MSRWSVLAALFACRPAAVPAVDAPDPSAPAPDVLFPFRRDGAEGYVDRDGVIRIQPRFQMALPFSEGLAGVLLDGEAAFVDTRGVVRFTAPHAALAPETRFQDGRVTLYGDWGAGYLWALFDAAGTRMDVQSPDPSWKLARVEPLAGGVARTEWWTGSARSCGFVDRDGRVVLTGPYDRLGDFSDGLAPAAGIDWNHGYLGLDGGWRIRPQFAAAEAFSEGLAKVTGGFIDTRGALVIRTRDDVERFAAFHEGRAVIEDRTTMRFGYIDDTGRRVIPARFVRAESFSEGLALVLDETGWGYIDRDGAWAIPPQFGQGDSFSGGLARVVAKRQPHQLGTLHYVDPQGRIVFTWTQALPEPALQ
jgi:hypothetical protein